MNLAKLDKFMPTLVIVLGLIDFGLVMIGLTFRNYFDALIPLITGLTIITLACCLIGYLVNQKYLKQNN